MKAIIALMTSEWEFKYPLVSVQAVDRGQSDLTPLLLDTGTSAFEGKNKQFKFELSWFTHEGFDNRVIEIWNKKIKRRNSVQRWNNKLSALRRILRGWVAQTNGEYKNKKLEQQSTTCRLDSIAEVRDLAEGELRQLAQSRDHLTKLLRDEEIKYYQRAKVKDILLRDNKQDISKW